MGDSILLEKLPLGSYINFFTLKVSEKVNGTHSVHPSLHA